MSLSSRREYQYLYFFSPQDRFGSKDQAHCSVAIRVLWAKGWFRWGHRPRAPAQG